MMKTTKSKAEAPTDNWKAWAVLVTLIGLFILSTGCRTRSGSREFIPGKGWVPN